MESNYRNRDFEQYIKENADQYRMFPSEKVWKGVNNALHTRRKWYGFWLGIFIIVNRRCCYLGDDYLPCLQRNRIQLQQVSTILHPPYTSSRLVSDKKFTQDIKSLLPFTRIKNLQLFKVPVIPGLQRISIMLPLAIQKHVIQKNTVDLLNRFAIPHSSN